MCVCVCCLFVVVVVVVESVCESSMLFNERIYVCTYECGGVCKCVCGYMCARVCMCELGLVGVLRVADG